MFFAIIKLTIITITLDTLFKIIIYLPVLSIEPNIFPNIANKINHNSGNTEQYFSCP